MYSFIENNPPPYYLCWEYKLWRLWTKLRVSYHVLSAPGPLGEKVLMFSLLSYFEVLAVSSPRSVAGSQVESCLNTAF